MKKKVARHNRVVTKTTRCRLRGLGRLANLPVQEKIIRGTKAITRALTLDEVMWVLIKNRRSESIRDKVEDIYAMPNLTVKEVPASAPLDVLNLTNNFQLKPRDAFHASVMKANGVTEIVSDDPDFDRVKGIKRIKLI